MKKPRARQLKSPEASSEDAAKPAATFGGGRASPNRFFFAAVFFAAVLAAYFPALRAGFIWDDNDHFQSNPIVQNPGGFIEIWTTAKAIYYPLTLTVWWAARRVFGEGPLPYHLLTVFFHAANALCLLFLLRRLRIPGAILGAAIFALHPIHVESAAWATELKNTLSGFFFLLSVGFFLSFEEKCVQSPEDAGADNSKARRGFWALSFACFFAAMLSKPSTVPLPAALCVLHVWRRRGANRPVLFSILPFFAAGIAWSAWTVWEQKYHSGAKGAEWTLTFADRLVNAGRIVWFYLAKMAWPHPLIFVYPRWKPAGGEPLMFVPLILAAGGWCALAWKSQAWKLCVLAPKRGGNQAKSAGDQAMGGGGEAMGAGAAVSFHVLAAFTLYMLLLFPVLGFFDIYYNRFSFVADHFAYLASMGPMALAGAGLAALAKAAAKAARGTPHAWTARAAGAALACLLAALTWRQCRMYQNDEVLWRRTLELNPGAWIGWNNLGFQLLHSRREDEAAAMFEKAISLKPDYDEAFNNWGLALLNQGRSADAVAKLERAIALRPQFADAWNNLASARAESGDLAGAAAACRKALEILPGDADYWANLGTLLARAKDYAEALKCFRKAQALKPARAEYAQRIEYLTRLLQASSGE